MKTDKNNWRYMDGSKQSEGECGLLNGGRWRGVMKRRFPFSPKFRKFRLEIKWNGPSVRSDRNTWDNLWRWSTLTGPVIFVGRTKMSLIIWKHCWPSTALLRPAYKSNNQTVTRGGLGQVCATGMYRSIKQVEFPKFQTAIFVEWKAPFSFLK